MYVEITRDVYKSYVRNNIIKKHCAYQKQYQIVFEFLEF